MNISLKLCDKKLNGDIPNYQFNLLEIDSEQLNDAQKLFYHWLESKNLEESVFVCFENHRGLPNEELRNEQKSILVSHNWDDITDFCEEHLKANADYDIDFAVFEFSDYQDAFGYCKDLRESF
jgi:hypothetical protein